MAGNVNACCGLFGRLKTLVGGGGFVMVGQQTFLLNPNLPPAFAAQGSPAALEWLLITVWKLGGAKVMSELEEIIFTGTRHVELVSKIFQTNAAQAAGNAPRPLTRLYDHLAPTWRRPCKKACSP